MPSQTDDRVAEMAPDMKEQTAPVVMETQLSNSSTDDWESSYSEVEISIESNRAMTEDESSSSSSEVEEESSYEQEQGQAYEELVEDYTESNEFTEVTISQSVQNLFADGNSSRQLDSTQNSAGSAARKSSSNRYLKSPSQSGPRTVEDFTESFEFTEVTVSESVKDLFAEANSSRQLDSTQNSAGSAARKSSSNRHLKSPSRSGPRTYDPRDVPPSSARRRKESYETAEEDERSRKSHEQQHQQSQPERINSLGSAAPADADTITSSAKTSSSNLNSSNRNLSQNSNRNLLHSDNNLQKHPKSAGSNASKKSIHKSIKIPALHNHKQEGDDYYIERQIKQEYNRRSRSLSRSSHGREKSSSRSRGHDRSRSNSKHGRQQGESSRHKHHIGENSHHGNTTSSSHSHHQDRSTNSAPRRISSIHTSMPSNEGSNKSNDTKHSNYDGSKRVSWKSDPKESFSDWTLHVVYRDSHNKRRIDVYHVHRNVVGFGHRKSNFLLRDIMKLEMQEFADFDFSNKAELELKELISSKNKKNRKKEKEIISRLKLPTESQARSVPMVLDFMYYTNETKQRMSADRSCNVFKVAEGLEVQALQKAIGEFYMKNLSLKNLGEFLTAATKVKADKLLNICKAKIGQMISAKPELSAMVPPRFMAEILDLSSRQLYEARRKEPKKYTREVVVSQSKYWSKAALICTANNMDMITQQLFQRLTAEECLPYIDVAATPKLLAIESSFSDNHGRPNQLTSLQRRCVESIGNDFDAFQACFDSHQEIAESLKHLPSNILSEILMQLMTTRP